MTAVAFISNLIGCCLAGEFTCKLNDSSFQFNDLAAYQKDHWSETQSALSNLHNSSPSTCWPSIHCMLGNFFTCRFFQNQLFPKILVRTLLECQTVWIQIRTNILSVLIWIQTVCKGYKQMTKVATSMGRVLGIS